MSRDYNKLAPMNEDYNKRPTSYKDESTRRKATAWTPDSIKQRMDIKTKERLDVSRANRLKQLGTVQRVSVTKNPSSNKQSVGNSTQPRTPEAWADFLNKNEVSIEDLQALKKTIARTVSDIGARIDWQFEFIEAKGLVGLNNVLQHYTGANVNDDAMKECMDILELVLCDEDGLFAAFKTPQLLENVMRCFMSRHESVKSQVVQFLTVFCWLVEGGNKEVLNAIDSYYSFEVASLPSDCAPLSTRLKFLFDPLNEEKLSIKVDILTFINALISTNESLEERIQLRNAFSELGVKQVFDKLQEQMQHHGDDEIIEQIRVFEKGIKDDKTDAMWHEVDLSDPEAVFGLLLQNAQSDGFSNQLLEALHLLLTIPAHREIGTNMWNNVSYILQIATKQEDLKKKDAYSDSFSAASFGIDLQKLKEILQQKEEKDEKEKQNVVHLLETRLGREEKKSDELRKTIEELRKQLDDYKKKVEEAEEKAKNALANPPAPVSTLLQPNTAAPSITGSTVSTSSTPSTSTAPSSTPSVPAPSAPAAPVPDAPTAPPPPAPPLDAPDAPPLAPPDAPPMAPDAPDAPPMAPPMAPDAPDAPPMAPPMDGVPPPPPMDGVPPPPPMDGVPGAPDAPGFGGPPVPPPIDAPPAPRGFFGSKAPPKPQGPKMKKLHWTQIDVTNPKQSFFGDMPMSELKAAVNIAELTDLFGEKKDAKGAGKKEEKTPLKPKKEEVKLIDPKRAYSIDIGLARFKMSHQLIRDCLVGMDETQLYPEKMAVLIKFCPTQEEIATIMTYLNGDGDPALLDNVGKFFLALASVRPVRSVPDLKTRLDLFYFKQQFSGMIDAVEKDLVIVEEACRQIKTSKALKNIFGVILSIGNVMNAGTPKGNAKGFHLSTLNQLKSTKSVDNSTSLLNVIILTTKRLPDPGNLTQELSCVQQASRIESQFLASEVVKIGAQVDRLTSALKIPEKSKDDMKKEKADMEREKKKKEERRKNREISRKQRAKEKVKARKEAEKAKKKAEKEKEKKKKQESGEEVKEEEEKEEEEKEITDADITESDLTDPDDYDEVRDYDPTEDKFEAVMVQFNNESTDRYKKLVARLDKLLRDCDDLVDYFGCARGEKWEEFFNKFDTFAQVYVSTENQLQQAKEKKEKEEKRAKAEKDAKEKQQQQKEMKEKQKAEKAALAAEGKDGKQHDVKDVTSLLRTKKAESKHLDHGKESAADGKFIIPTLTKHSDDKPHDPNSPSQHPTQLRPPPKSPAHRTSIVAKMFDTLKKKMPTKNT